MKLKLNYIYLTLLAVLFASPVKAQLPPDIPYPSKQWVHISDHPYRGRTPSSKFAIDSRFANFGVTRGIWTRTTFDWPDDKRVKYHFTFTVVNCTNNAYTFAYNVLLDQNLTSVNEWRGGLVGFAELGTDAHKIQKAVCI